MRESDSQSLKLPPMRARRGRSLIDRLRQVGKPGEVAGGEPTSEIAAEPDASLDPQPYDFLDGYERTGAGPVPARDHARDDAYAQPQHAQEPEQHYVASADGLSDHHEHGSYVGPAVDVFNSSEFPRRLAGVARSLGAPTINVRSAEHLESVVRIMVAWELCWYRYEVDLSEAGAETRIVAQGTELDEIAREERVGNAVADDSGGLTLV
jgi:hypothetical protein